MKKTMIYLIFLVFFYSLFADEVGWTEKERSDKRDIVIAGEVTKLAKLHDLKNSKYTEIWKAELKVLKVYKGEKKLLGNSIQVVFERGTLIKSTKIRNKRCPRYAELKKGNIRKFFLMKCNEAHLKMLELGKYYKGAFFLEMGSDVTPMPNLPGSKLTLKQAVEKSSHIFKGISLNDPGPGIMDEYGISYHNGSFNILEMIYGDKLAKKNISLSYTLWFLNPRFERGPGKGEKVIVFMKKSQAIKIIPENKENQKKVELLIKGK